MAPSGSEKSSQEYPVNAVVSHGSILVICDTAIDADDTTLYSIVVSHVICCNN